MSQQGKGRVSARLGWAGEKGTVADQILEAVRRAPGCPLDDLDFSSPELTWNQILLEIDRLNRTGQLETISKGF
jgi:hypothetical protein